MKRLTMETLVGLFVVVGILALAYLSIRLGKLEVVGDRGYTVVAEFDSVAGLKSGAVVEIAGVEVGRVKKIGLDSYRARVAMSIDPDVKLQDDAIVSIRTKGLIGEKYVRITPGGSDTVVQPGGKLRDTEDPIDIEQLISNYIFGKL
ncbi:ABC transporter substrate-binding protein [Candidatus Methylomirabilis lanthanidiphila]|uniref:ABC transporter substrate-binding protein n=1 Tax=Candidatus Methylomirabilis lanthanidiphila TaxID=2211376 RepID=A0A564ZFL6_9BACT|nr:outer membrane lipid asymmetry maintenance protein MlaD [Candidatus Methylomirabilis lanthanidiphila]VUZ84100.1 ABC transporter substrate-binding protein [Candidatus Methylomirabilis lanthanidiphila]